MTNFKAGDTVKRVRGGSFYEVREGGVYTIRRVLEGQGIELIGHPSNYDPNCFVIYQEVPVVSVSICFEVAALHQKLRDQVFSLKSLKEAYDEQVLYQEAEIASLEASLSAIKTKYNIED